MADLNQHNVVYKIFPIQIYVFNSLREEYKLLAFENEVLGKRIMIFWVVMSFISVEVHQRFRGMCDLRLQGRRARKERNHNKQAASRGRLLPNYTALQQRRSYSPP
jgi:hypothetical protein